MQCPLVYDACCHARGAVFTGGIVRTTRPWPLASVLMQALVACGGGSGGGDAGDAGATGAAPGATTLGAGGGAVTAPAPANGATSAPAASPVAGGAPASPSPAPAPAPVSTPAPAASPAPGASTSIAINAGGPAFAPAGATAFQADAYYTGGTAVVVPVDVSGTDLDTVYDTARSGEFGYAIPLAEGLYEVTLRFAEVAAEVTRPGQRVFDVAIEAGEPGEQRVRGVDAWSAAGANAAYDVVRIVAVSGGALELRFSNARAGEARVSAIGVRPAPAGSVPTRTGAQLVNEALVALRGAGSVVCSSHAAGAITTTTQAVPFALGADALRVGTDVYPLAAVRSVSLTTTTGAGVHAQLVVDRGAGRTLDVAFELNGDTTLFGVPPGDLLSVDTRRSEDPDDVYVGCGRNQSPTRWGAFGGDGPALLQATLPMASTHRPVRLACTWTAAWDGWATPYASVYLVDVKNGAMTIEDTAPASPAHVPPGPHTLVPAGGAGYTRYNYRTVTVSVDDVVQYTLSPSISFAETVTVDVDGIVRGASWEVYRGATPSSFACPVVR